MDILNSLSKKDSHWRKVAFNMTKNKNDADNLVQDMYLRMYKYNPEKWNYSYIYLTMWNIFKDKYKALKYDVKLNEEIYKDVTITENYSYNDSDLQVLEKIYKLSDEERKLLSYNYDMSFGEIANNLEQCRIKTFRDITKIRKKVLGNDLKGYKNRRLKWKK